MQASQVRLEDVGMQGRHSPRRGAFNGHLPRNRLRRLALQRENVMQFRIIGPRPYVRLIADPDELGADPNPAGRATHAAFQDVIDSQFGPDLGDAFAGALVVHR